MTLNIIITGGSGYVAQQLIPHFRNAGHGVLAYSRHEAPGCTVVGDYLTADYDSADVVIHTAARAHVKDKSDEFFVANTELPVDLAQHLAGRAKPPRFIFFSSIGAREMERRLDKGLPHADARSEHPYQLSKLEAERKLETVHDIDITCLRPPLIYGPNCPGNLPRMLTALRKRWPLPVGCATSPRHYLYIGNLISALQHIIDNPEVGFQIHEVSDAEAISTRALTERLAALANVQPRLIMMSPPLMKLLLGSVGQSRVYSSLFEPLLIQNTLENWRPPYSLFDGLKAFVTGATNASTKPLPQPQRATA